MPGRNDLILALFAVHLAVESPGLAQDAMPKAAPDFRQSSNTIDYVEPTRVRIKSNSTSDALPLTGSINRFDAKAQNAALSGNVEIIQTPPALSGAVSKIVPPEMFRVWLQKSHPAFVMSASSLSAGSVVEVKGRWDQAGRTLKALGIPFRSIGSHALSDLSFDGVKVLVVNCAGSVPKDSLQNIRDFVASGGYLLTTDWALDNLVEKAFPGYIAWDRKKNDKAIYDAYVVNPDPVLFSHTVTNAHWKMDEASHLLRVLKPDAVRVLARSHQLEREDPGGQGIVAVTFPFGRGHVLHLVGHFDNNAALLFTNSMPDPAPVIDISLRQAIGSNFVVAGLTNVKIP